MAIPIKDTPVLKGKDAAAFTKQVEASSKKSITKEQLQSLNNSKMLFEQLYGKK